jgi:hypothetical protein
MHARHGHGGLGLWHSSLMSSPHPVSLTFRIVRVARITWLGLYGRAL